jgi:Leucine-rich repeat (LRR) protein
LGNYYKLNEGFNLKFLDASENRIKKLEPLSLPNSLESVFLRENKIKSVAPSTFLEKSHLARVDLTSNLIKQLQLTALAIELREKQGEEPTTAKPNLSSEDENLI